MPSAIPDSGLFGVILSLGSTLDFQDFICRWPSVFRNRPTTGRHFGGYVSLWFQLIHWSVRLSASQLIPSMLLMSWCFLVLPLSLSLTAALGSPFEEDISSELSEHHRSIRNRLNSGDNSMWTLAIVLVPTQPSRNVSCLYCLGAFQPFVQIVLLYASGPFFSVPGFSYFCLLPLFPIFLLLEILTVLAFGLPLAILLQYLHFCYISSSGAKAKETSQYLCAWV